MGKLASTVRCLSSKAKQEGHRFKPARKFDVHLCDGPAEPSLALSREQGAAMLSQMMTIRRMEMAADALYKQRLIRGFCHLAVGQEAVPVGMEAALGAEDAVITAYRCHGFALLRGASVQQVIGELLGRRGGVSRGKGGSMHMFADRFYGGNGIVGAQVPVGLGIAFAQRYRDQPAATFAMYGDGAANQGQVFESFNMASLWRLPVVFVCENNRYGMGTAAQRSSAVTDYYKRAGDMMPGIRVDGQDVVSVHSACLYSRQYAVEHGPIILELQTYRYHGHSMSDPGTSYRTRDEVQQQRQQRDPIKSFGDQLVASKWLTPAQVKDMDAQARQAVDAQVQAALLDLPPDDQQFWADVYHGAETGTRRGCLDYE